MHSPITRLFTVLELLQSYKQMSGSELARRLEVDGRTVRRYIVACRISEFRSRPSAALTGRINWSAALSLPPLMFTDAEAVALTLGLLAIREYRFPVDVAAVEGALAKTERVMPEKLLQQVARLAGSHHLSCTRRRPVLLKTILASHSVQRSSNVSASICAIAPGAATSRERDFDPYGIVFNEGYWYTTGYCHLRHDLRTFRLDRIVTLEARDQVV